ncbi:MULTISPECIES: hypothetical protein [unclassified Streptomyces]|uniref:hypothetical protein n=1 Tax=unclassified Streptomyces TaxID=2593676 RepID=UPI002E31C73F|nr:MULTISPECIES: hypothetical protein [unclassified Streptomyces]WUC68502.1 hypothetical protein OG861_32105 [Streptomyces sp. NBC_00539]
MGSRLRILITSERTPDLLAEITPQATADLDLADGSDIWTSRRAADVMLVEL